ncbi:MAG: HlyC/CorC family transporter [Ruminococcaceae bacterium]|nr:HlyC/CorC family transporter [Oscillospiraceae bacterium]
MPDGSLLKIILMLICLAFSAFFSSSETAFTSFNHTKMKNLASEGNKKAALVMKMSDNYDKLLSTILVGNNIVNIALSSIATIWFMQLLANGPVAGYYSAISTIITTVVVLIFGEITPKSLAKDRPEGFAMGVAPFLRGIIVILMPVNFLFMLWKKLMSKIFKPAEEEAVTEGEVLTLVDEAHEGGSIDEYNKELIENIFDFDDLSAGEIATHRTDMTMLAEEDSIEEWETIINNSRFSRYPVFGENVDDIIGVLDAREYFRLEDKSLESIRKNAIKPAYFVPETVKADVLFRNMKKNKEFIAIVLDEYGGVQGLVTFTDLVECLVGEFAETDDNEEPLETVEQLEENRWQINGTATVSEVEDALGLEIADCDSDTFGGFVLGLYGSIPEDGSTFELSTEQMDISVLEIKDHRIEKAVVTLKEPAEEDDEKEKEKEPKPSKSEAVQA